MQQISVGFDEKLSAVRAKIQGALNPETAAAASRQARKVAEETGAKKFLVDMTAAEDQFTVSQRYAYMSSMASRGCEQNERYALVFSKLTPDTALSETVAINRGYHVRAFSSVTEAEVWLAADAQPGPT